MIRHLEVTISKHEVTSIKQLTGYMEAKYSDRLLRWYIADATAVELKVDVILDQTILAFSENGGLPPLSGPVKSAVMNIIPTGIGCSIGGFAGDAAPVTNLLSSCADYVITNPNAVNASNFISTAGNLLYTEGYLLDLFCKQQAAFYIPAYNKVGLVIEKTTSDNLHTIFNIVNTVRAVHGVNIEHIEITDELIQPVCGTTSTGAYIGNVKNIGTLGRACQKLIEKGVNAIAITSNIGGFAGDNYMKHFSGDHPNPVGGVEAVISHWVCRNFGVPAAHGPMINFKDFIPDDEIVDARSAGEYISTSGLACVLIGLRNAPQVDRRKAIGVKDVIMNDSLLAVVCPEGAIGGVPALYAAQAGVPVIIVEENGSILNIDNSFLFGLPVYKVKNYPEAAGLILALRQGISIESVRRPLRSIRPEPKRATVSTEA